ncbi:uncharacterized protein LOC142178050 [Nicotiana tabacum]|uniref:Uncharacterized protein LOC142178050 n=1 Tax=Nicotiana tabacum TaxID=4097 RepID=A0AC58U1V5_TOBAC
MKQEINNFMQTDTESVYQAWKRLAAMLRKCPHHGIQDPVILYIFYHGLKPSARNVIDTTSGGSIIGKITTEAMQLLNEISKNAVQWPSDRMIIKKTAGVNQVEALNSLTQQIATLTQKNGGFSGNHPNHECQASTQNEEQVNAIGYRNNYSFDSPMAQKHLGFQWSNPNGAENPQIVFNQKQQVSQLATLMSEKIQGALPSNTEKNPKEHLKAISLRAGKSLDDPYVDREGKPQEVKKMNREKLDKQFSKFLDILKQLYINIPFADALTQMPSYAKFLKEILSSKRKLEEVSVVKLTEKYSAILQNKLPQKLDDLGSFTIPCTVGGAHFEKALCDSGASINLMPISIFRKLELGEMKDAGVSLQLADQSTKTPKGIIENILVRVDKFVFPIDFIVLEMEENTEVPLILGRPFLATGRAIIDVHQGQLILLVDEERMIFDMQKMIKFPGDESSSSCFQIDLLDDLVDEYKDNQLISDSLEICLARSGTISDDNPIIREGWTPKQQIPKTNIQQSLTKASSSKAALKENLKQALQNIDNYEEHQIMQLIEDTASTGESSNRDMCNPKGIALAYMDPNCE